MKWILKERGYSSKRGMQYQNQDFRYDCENLARIAKINNHSENFASLAKFSLCENFARLAKFRSLAKFTVPSENFQFRYLTRISLD